MIIVIIIINIVTIITVTVHSTIIFIVVKSPDRPCLALVLVFPKEKSHKT